MVEKFIEKNNKKSHFNNLMEFRKKFSNRAFSQLFFHFFNLKIFFFSFSVSPHPNKEEAEKLKKKIGAKNSIYFISFFLASKWQSLD